MPATTAAARRWAELLDLHDTSDLSTRAFAAQHGVNHSTLVTTVEAQGTPEELHLSVSLTTDVEPMRLAWAAGGPRHVALIARPQAG
ncbi:MAG TPA: hypothetical protein PKA64_04610, partial [Myxococcota bacterium]|nr:hypothetical protein [Myxococcota bacterium]